MLNFVKFDAIRETEISGGNKRTCLEFFLAFLTRDSVKQIFDAVLENDLFIYNCVGDIIITLGTIMGGAVRIMNMTACDVCGKIFGSTGRAVCPACRKLLDIVYEKARTYLRDNPKVEIRAPELAKAIGEDVRLVEILVAEGRFTGNPDDAHEGESIEEKKRKKLIAEIEKNLSASTEKAQPRVTYGQDRHGRGSD